MLFLNHVFVVIVCLFNLVLGEKCECKDLLALVTLFRHGARGPILVYKNDPYLPQFDELWPDGYEQLTNKGKMEQYELGNWFRQYYKDFIPDKYSNKFLKVVSSNRDRALMSAACNLAGLFPPKGNQVWNKNLLWQPIPIHTTPEVEDSILALRKPCPKFDKMYAEFLQCNAEAKSVYKDAEPICEYIKKYTDEEYNGVDLSYIQYFHDTIFVEKQLGLQVPKWTQKIYPDVTFPFILFKYMSGTYTTELSRLKIGPLIHYVTSFFENVLDDPEKSFKFLMLSAHDNTMVYFLNSLGIFDRSWPEYASAINLELRKKPNANYITIEFKNSTGLYKLKLNDCDVECNFDVFKALTNRVRIDPEKWTEECNNV